MMLVETKTHKETSMTQLNFTLEPHQIQEIIDKSGANDLAKQLLTTVFNQLMEKQRDDYIKAEAYERGDTRNSQRNGYYDRTYSTRVGRLTLTVPRTRDGKFSVDIFERYQRNEQALLATILEMYVQGVSTRKVTRIVEELCGTQVSKSFVSSLTDRLDEDVEQFLTRPLSQPFPFIMSDVLYIKVREHRRVVSKAFHIVVGINSDGERHVLGFSLNDSESYSTWSSMYTQLVQRGLSGVKMVISDAHKGEVAAIKEHFLSASWQRCQVHFMRNVFDKLPRKNSEEVRSILKILFKTTDIDLARRLKNEITDKYEEAYPTMLECLDEGFEDAFQYCTTRFTNHNRLKSTNMLERVNEEIRRREKVVRIFPNQEAALRLIGSVLIDINDEWNSSSRIYINYSEETRNWIK